LRSPTTRLSALALAAIVAPATIVAILGYVSLRQWESSAELLFREQARDVATMAAEKVEMMLRLAEDAFLDRLQRQLAADDVTETALDRIVTESRLVRRLYVFERDGSLLYPRTWRDPADAALFGEVLRPRMQAVWERGGKREVAADGQVCLVVLLRPRREPVLVAYARDAEALRRDILETSLGALESPTIVSRGVRCTRGARSSRPSRCWPCRCARGCRTGAWPCTRRRAPRRAPWCAVRSCCSRAPSGCWWRSSWPAWCSHGG
jgi:hypothetical protein